MFSRVLWSFLALSSGLLNGLKCLFGELLFRGDRISMALVREVREVPLGAGVRVSNNLGRDFVLRGEGVTFGAGGFGIVVLDVCLLPIVFGESGGVDVGEDEAAGISVI